MSDHTIIVRGPHGVIMDAEIDVTLRFVRRLAIDDAKLKELLVLTSVCGGTVEAELMKQQAASKQPPLGTLEDYRRDVEDARAAYAAHPSSMNHEDLQAALRALRRHFPEADRSVRASIKSGEGGVPAI